MNLKNNGVTTNFTIDNHIVTLELLHYTMISWIDNKEIEVHQVKIYYCYNNNHSQTSFYYDIKAKDFLQISNILTDRQQTLLKNKINKWLSTLK